MKTKSYSVYTFDELSEKAKEHAKQKYYENEDYPFLGEDLKESLKDRAPYWKETELQYSLSCCQGDGLSFSGTLDLKAFLEKFFPAMKRAGVMLEYIYKIYSTGNKGHYQYAARAQVDIDYNYTRGRQHKRLDKLAESIVEKVRDEYMDVCKKLEKEGYGILEYRMTDDEFAEHCEVNNYEFTEDGTLA